MITLNGETKSAAAWAKSIGIHPKSFARRYEKYEQGESTVEHLMAPTSGLGPIASNKPIGLRTKALESLFEAFVSYGVPKLKQEVKEYMATGKIGHAMAFFTKYKEFFPKEKLEALDGDTKKAVAQFAVVFNNYEQPKNYEVITEG